MPGFDGTGPMGMGPMTGGGRGFCSPYSPLRAAAGFTPPAYWPRPVGALPTVALPPVPAYAPGYYSPAWFGRGVWPQMMGGMPRRWGSRGGRGRGGRRGHGGFPFATYRGYPW